MTDKNNQPMDPSMPEGPSPTFATSGERNCWAMDTLITEVEQAFPGVIYEVSNRNGRGVAFDVQFVPYDEDSGLADVLALMGDPAYNEDPRIAEVLVDSEGVLVSFTQNVRIQDSREPFGIAGVHAVLSGQESL